MKKRVFSILTALCLCLSMLPMAAFATEDSGAAPEEPQEQQEEVNPEANPEQPEDQPEVNPAEQPAEENGVPVALSAEGETVIKLTQSNISDYVSSGLTDGSYQLGGNVTITSGTLKVAGTVTLDLNGYTLTITDPKSANVQHYNNAGKPTAEPNPIGILVYSDVDGNGSYTLTLKDGSEANTGTLNVEGEGAKDATGIYVGCNCTLNIEGGTITDSYQRSGNETLSSTGVQAVLGTVKMTGGSIKKQTYGVFLYGSNMTISDNAEISDCGYLDGSVSRSGSGVFVMRGYLASGNNSGINGSNIVASALTMTGGTIENCMSAAAGGGVFLEAESTFTMTSGTITGCKSGENGVGSSGSHGGGVYVGGTFNMSGSASITNCEATGSGSGGGVLVGGTFNMSGDAKITGCKAAAGGGGVYVSGDPSGQTAFNMSGNASITNCEAIGGCGGGVYLARCTFTMKDTASITGCKATEISGNIKDGDCIMIESPKSVTLNIADTVTINGQITQYGDNNDRIDGLGTEKAPYQISTAKELKWFRDIVNGANGQTQNLGACAELTADIDLGNEAWTPIGNTDEVNGTDAYSGIFDGQGHTISGLNVMGDFQWHAGLFGITANATIQNLSVSGSVSASAQRVGGIVGSAARGTTIKNCSNHCNVTNFRCIWAGGVAGAVYNTSTIIDCYNTGLIHQGTSNATIPETGGIAGDNAGTISNCYNVGSVSCENDKFLGSIAGYNNWRSSNYTCTVENCYYLGGTDLNAVGRNDIPDNITKTEPKSAAEFADGTVLNLLIDNRAENEHPWAAECKYVTAAGKTLPVFKWQGDTHEHSGAWTSNGDGTHSRTCACGVTETVNCSGGTATCTKQAVCNLCGVAYGAVNSDNHANLVHVLAKAATTSEEGNIEYWYCEACDKYYSDEGTKNEILQSETVIPRRQSSSGSSGGSSSYPITVPGKTENGSVSVSPKSASKGSTVTITVTPDSGYVLETISVTDKNGDELKLTDKGNGKYTFTMPGSKVEVKVTFTEDNSVLNFFYDVPNDAYYYEAVKWAVENGITGGIGNSLFAPNQPCTRAQIVTFLWRAAGSPVVNYLMPFTDVDESAYYAEAVRWAASTGIITGLTETTFGTNNVCTRAQAAAMIYRYAQAQGKGFTGAWMFLLPFTDVPEWAYESVAWCYMNGVTTGVSETTFAPGNDCTRAQIVTFLYRAYQGN